MAIRSPHGKMKNGGPRIEVLPVDELPVGVPAPARPVPDRSDSGMFTAGPGTREMARAAGIASAEQRRSGAQLGRLLGLVEFPDDHPWAPYARLARAWRDDHLSTISDLVGGGEIGPGPSSIVSSAALQLAASRWFSDRGAETCDSKMLAQGSALANDSRQNLLAAHELAAKEAFAREARRKASAKPFDLGAALSDADEGTKKS